MHRPPQLARLILQLLPSRMRSLVQDDLDEEFEATLAAAGSGPRPVPMSRWPCARWCQDVVRRLDAGLPLYGTRRLDDVVAASVGSNRFNLSLAGLFAVLAMVLGGVGIYGVISYSVAERTREMGLRMALGARGRDVVGMVVGGGLLLTLAGVVLGLAGAVVSGRFLQGMLYEVPPTDSATLAAVAATLMAVALLASWLPARRASRVDPLEALRQE